MNRRLIPWCLAATGFFVALSTFAWRGQGIRLSRVEPPAAAGRRLLPSAGDQQQPESSQDAVRLETPETAAPTGVLPLPPAGQPEPDPNLQPVPDDEPTVDDLPPQRSPPESSAGE